VYIPTLAIPTRGPAASSLGDGLLLLSFSAATAGAAGTSAGTPAAAAASASGFASHFVQTRMLRLDLMFSFVLGGWLIGVELVVLLCLKEGRTRRTAFHRGGLYRQTGGAQVKRAQ
jgi:hypothetical protein